jgi:hypothetical protein
MKFWKTVAIVGIPYAVLMIIFRAFTVSPFTMLDVAGVLLSSLLFGIFFTFAAQLFSKWQMKKIVIHLESDETLVKEGGATRILNHEGVGGKLAVTNKRIAFKSHRFNIQNHQGDFPLAEINSVETGKSIGFLNNVLFLTLKDGSVHKFIVNEPQEWKMKVDFKKVGAV